VNYVKKIKSLGFKKIEPTVVCNFRDEKIDGKYLYGHKLRPLSEVRKEKEVKSSSKYSWSPVMYDFDYPRVPSQYVSKINSYYLKISEEVSIYLILVGNEYTLVVNNNSAIDIIDNWSIHSEKIKVPIAKCYG
jgi:hypothetical protein